MATIEANPDITDVNSHLEADPNLSAGCIEILPADPDEETIQDANNLIIEQNIVCLSDASSGAISSDLCEVLAPGEQLSIIVGDEVSELGGEDQVWTASPQDLTLTPCYYYECDGNTYKISAESPLSLTELPPPKPAAEVHTCEFPGCGRQFGAVGYLKIHQLIHNDEKKTDCPYGCGKTFSRPGHLKYHQMTHTGVRPYVCSYEGCGSSFFTNQRLMVHNRLHTGERPYICRVDHCNKTFTTAGNLRNHGRIHSGERPFVCDFEGCTKKFTEFSSLKKHKVIHSGDRRFVCDECGQAFTQSGSRNVHIQRRHPKTPTIPVRHLLIPALPDNYTQGGTTTTSVAVDTDISTTDVVSQNGDISTELILAGRKDSAGSTDDVDDSAFIIVSGTKGSLVESDQVVTVSTQSHYYYQDTLDLPSAVLQQSEKSLGEKVKVQTEIANPDVSLSPYC